MVSAVKQGALCRRPLFTLCNCNMLLKDSSYLVGGGGAITRDMVSAIIILRNVARLNDKIASELALNTNAFTR